MVGIWNHGGDDEVKIGDLIKFESTEEHDLRMHGTILRFSIYEGACGRSSRPPESIIEVLWNTGELGWILAERVKVFNV